jgi:glutamate/tyrosine decarboxylase-like PLP-dependent enzyme
MLELDASERRLVSAPPYTEYCLPRSGLGRPFLKSVDLLMSRLGALRTDASRTAAPRGSVGDSPRTVPHSGRALGDVVDDVIVRYLGDVPNYSSGYALCNVIPPSLTPAILAKIATAIVNPNLVHGCYGGLALEAEQLAVRHLVEVLGFDPERAGGYFTSGGTASNYWAVRYAMEKAFPGFSRAGFPSLAGRRPVMFQSVLGHYSNINAARLMGIGTDNLIRIPVTADFAVDLQAFRKALERAVIEGHDLVCVYLVAGYTDSFGVDDVESACEIVDEICARHGVPRPHIHVDAAVGWAYRFFRGYDTAVNDLDFGGDTLETIERLNTAYRGLHLADSVTVDLHKQGFVSCTASALLLKDRADLALVAKNSDETSYFGEEAFRAFPGAYTFEASRSGDGPLMTLANLHALGVEGYRTLIGQTLQRTNKLRAALRYRFGGRIQVLNEGVAGASTLWRIYPPGMDAGTTWRSEVSQRGAEDRALVERVNAYNDALFARRRKLSDARTPILGYSQKALQVGDASIGAWRCVIFHPQANVDAVVESVGSVLTLEDAEATPDAGVRDSGAR